MIDIWCALLLPYYFRKNLENHLTQRKSSVLAIIISVKKESHVHNKMFTEKFCFTDFGIIYMFSTF